MRSDTSRFAREPGLVSDNAKVIGTSSHQKTVDGCAAGLPVVLRGPTPFLGSCAIRIEQFQGAFLMLAPVPVVFSNKLQGAIGFSLRAAGVVAIYELFRHPGQSLYACVLAASTGLQNRHADRASAIPKSGETLSDFVLRISRTGDNSVRARLALVHCMIECHPSQWRRFYGMPPEQLSALYSSLVADRTLASIRDARTASLDAWDSIRHVLPLIHMNVRTSFRQHIISPAADFDRADPLVIFDREEHRRVEEQPKPDTVKAVIPHTDNQGENSRPRRWSSSMDCDSPDGSDDDTARMSDDE